MVIEAAPRWLWSRVSFLRSGCCRCHGDSTRSVRGESTFASVQKKTHLDLTKNGRKLEATMGG